MSDYCPHCDDFSIDASRASRKPAKSKGTLDNDVAKGPKKITINVDSSDENSDWIKKVRDEDQDKRKD